MYDDVARRLARERQDRVRDRLGMSVVDRLREEAFDLGTRRAAYLTSELTAASRAAQELREQRLDAVNRSIEWMTKDPRGQQWQPPAPTVRRQPVKPRFSF